MFCTKCGKELKEGARFCTGCGKPITPPGQQAAPVQPEPVAQTTQQMPDVTGQISGMTGQLPDVTGQIPDVTGQMPVYTDQPMMPDPYAMQPMPMSSHSKSGMGTGGKIAIAIVSVICALLVAAVALMKMGIIDANEYLPALIAEYLSSDKEDADEEESDEETTHEVISEEKTETAPAAEEPAVEAPAAPAADDEMVTLDRAGDEDVDEAAPAAEEPVEEEEVVEEEYKEPDYIFPDSSERELTEDDLRNLTAWECRVARNEIYARHGRMFDDEELRDYFEGKDWYNGTIPASKFNENKLFNKVEKANAYFIDKYERKKGYK